MSVPGPPPPTPSGLRVTATTFTTISLACDPDAGATRYGWWVNGALVTISAAPIVTLTGLAPNTLYYLQVSAGNAGGASANSAPITGSTVAGQVPPPTPSGLRVTATTFTTISLACNPSPGATRYGWWVDGALVNVGAPPTVTLVGLAPGTQYTFEVSCGNAVGPSGNSAPIPGATAIPPPLPAPTGLKVGGISPTTILLGCDAEAGATRYAWWVNGVIVWSTTTPAVFLHSLTPGVAYTFNVTTGNAYVSSPGSAPLVVTMPTATAGCPTTPCPAGTDCVNGACVAPNPGPAGVSSVWMFVLLGGVVGGVILYERAHKGEAAPARAPLAAAA